MSNRIVRYLTYLLRAVVVFICGLNFLSQPWQGQEPLKVIDLTCLIIAIVGGRSIRPMFVSGSLLLAIFIGQRYWNPFGIFFSTAAVFAVLIYFQRTNATMIGAGVAVSCALLISLIRVRVMNSFDGALTLIALGVSCVVYGLCFISPESQHAKAPTGPSQTP